MQNNERHKLTKVLKKAQILINTNKAQQALLLLNKQKGKLATHPELLRIKARSLTEMGRYEVSQSILETLHSRFPGEVGILANLALNLNLMKRHDEAVEYAASAVKQKPNDIGLLMNLASTYRANSMISSAIETLLSAERLAPHHQDIIFLLSELLIQQGDYLEALQRLLRMTASPTQLMLLLDCYCNLNWYDDAHQLIPDIESILSKQDDYYKALFITRLQQLGEFTKIESLLDGPPPLGNPQLLLAYVQSAPLDTPSLLELSDHTQKCDFEKSHKRSLLYALSGRLFNSQETEQAFELLGIASQMQQIPVVEQVEINRVFDKIKTTFSSWDSTELSGSKSSVPIFVIGMPRSGTTLVESILTAHSQVVSAGEAKYMNLSLNGQGDSIISHTSSTRYLEKMHGWGKTDIERIAHRYLAYLRQHSGKSRHVVDKLPHNFLHLGMIRKLFPNATIVHCVRNPIATCLSIYKQHLSDYHAYSTELCYLSEYYNNYQELMAYWAKAIEPLDLVEISYESLVTDHESAVRQLLADCALDFEETCLNFHQQNNIVKTLSFAQVRNKIYRNSLRPWKNQEAFIQPLLEAFPQHIQ